MGGGGLGGKVAIEGGRELGRREMGGGGPFGRLRMNEEERKRWRLVSDLGCLIVLGSN